MQMSSRDSAARDLGTLEGRGVLVIGDLILDHYLEGEVERISPEAPVPVVALKPGGERSVPGGAANVAMNVASLGGRPMIAGLTGDDADGSMLLDLLGAAGIETSAVMADRSRPTTSKTRIVSRNQQILRIDREVTDTPDEAVGNSLLVAVTGLLDRCDAVLFEDYDKGCISPGLITTVVSECRTRGIPVAVDPKFRNFLAYQGCTLVKPNRLEASRITGMEIRVPRDAAAAARVLLGRLGATAVLVTLGEQGSVLAVEGREPVSRPTAARRVYDVSGAGDTVIAVMALGIAASLGFERSAELANLAAAAVCAVPGVYAVKPADILREMRDEL